MGTTAANVIAKRLKATKDNVDVTIYANLVDFSHALDTRSMLCDRFIIMNEVFSSVGATQEVIKQQLIGLRTILSKTYTGIPAIFVNKSEDTLKLSTEVFNFSGNYLSIQAPASVKATFINSLVDMTVEELRKEYYTQTMQGIIETRKKIELEAQAALNKPVMSVVEEVPSMPVTVARKTQKPKEDFAKLVEDLDAPLDFDVNTMNTSADLDFSDSNELSVEMQVDDLDSELQDLPTETDLQDLHTDFVNSPEDLSAAEKLDFTQDFSFTDTPESNSISEVSFDTDLDFGSALDTSAKSVKQVSNNLDDLNINLSEIGISDNLVRRKQNTSNKTMKIAESVDDIYSFNAIETERRRNDAIQKTQQAVVQQQVLAQLQAAQHQRNTQLSGGVGLSKYDNIIHGKTREILVVTGDRRSGVTTSAISIAQHFAQYVNTLYVDFDKDRRGSLFIFGFDQITCLDESVQRGVELANKGVSSGKGRDIGRYTFRPDNCNFDAMVALTTYQYTDADMVATQVLLASQSKYAVVVIDCPLEHLHNLANVTYLADFFICVENDVRACSNTIIELDSLVPLDEESEVTVDEPQKAIKRMESLLLTTFAGKAKYLVRQSDPESQFDVNMHKLSSLYALDTADEINWADFEVAGFTDNIEMALQGMT